MKHFLLMMALIAPLALAACDNKEENQNESTQTGMTSTDVPNVAPSAGENASSTPAAPSIAVGEPNPAAPKAECPHQDWVGKKMDEVDLTTIKGPTRTLYPDSPATMDYNPDRINIILEKDTDIITEVRCG